ncbi:C2H2 zinc finger protein [Musa troglodytarum]|nr:C2H2 zinc finger protein [Musa troglodytarum]
MAVAEVDKQMLRELELMGFPTARATRALHFSGNSTIEAAINWVIEHENDPDIDQMPLVPINIEIENGTSWMTPDEVKIKLQKLRTEYEQGRSFCKQSKLTRKMKEKGLMLLLRKVEKEQEKRAREKILQKLREDKAERRSKLGLQPQDPGDAKSVLSSQGKKSSVSVNPATKAEHMRDCLRSLKKTHKDDDARVKRAFQTLLIYVRNVAMNPDAEKFRKIRLGNPNFQDRVARLKGGMEFLELCGFEKLEGDEYLCLPRDKVDMAVLSAALSQLNSAMENPFFGGGIGYTTNSPFNMAEEGNKLQSTPTIPTVKPLDAAGFWTGCQNRVRDKSFQSCIAFLHTVGAAHTSHYVPNETN